MAAARTDTAAVPGNTADTAAQAGIAAGIAAQAGRPADIAGAADSIAAEARVAAAEPVRYCSIRL